MAAKRIPTVDVPQKDRLADVRAVVDALAENPGEVATVAKESGLTDRHTRYAMNAARILGFVSGDDWSVTPAGEKLINTARGSLAERIRFRGAIEQSRVLRVLAPKLLGTNAPSMDALARRIMQRSELSESTAFRRAQTLLSWRQQALDPQLPLPLPEPIIEIEVPADIPRLLGALNPWWEGKPSKAVPPTKRDFVNLVERRLEQRIAQITLVRGPRQVGKTTAQLQIIEQLLANGLPPEQILRVQYDELPSLTRRHEPILTILDWYQRHILKTTINASERVGRPVYVFLDEVQNIPTWAAELKQFVDLQSVRVLVTGSSALRIGRGRDSLAGRISTVEVGTLTLREIASLRFKEELPRLSDRLGENLASIDLWRDLKSIAATRPDLRASAFTAFAERGGYPLAQIRPDLPWSDIANQLNETIVNRVIALDIGGSLRGRSPDTQLLEEVFRLGCRYIGQCPGPKLLASEASRALDATVSVERIRNYLDALDLALLLRPVRPLELRTKKSQGASKLCLVDHGLRASWLSEVVPIAPEELRKESNLCELAGHIVESIVGTYFLGLQGSTVAHFPRRDSEPEVDFVLTVGDRRIPVEVKYRRRLNLGEDTAGLRSFLDKSVYNAPFGVLVTQDEFEIEDERIICVPLPVLLSLY